MDTPQASPAPLSDAVAIVDFWRDAGREKWFDKDDAFDETCRKRLGGWHLRAARRELEHWNDSADGSLALMILLDQFPRNAWRGTAHMYATDPLARRYARQAVLRGFDASTDEALRQFFYLPFMHSEELADQQRCVELCTALGEESARYARHHRDIVARFGRFPHRNRMLARDSTAKEQAFLDAGGFAG